LRACEKLRDYNPERMAMSHTAVKSAGQIPGAGMRMRNLATSALYTLLQIFPKLLQLRRNKESMLALRVALGICGAALVVLPLSLWEGWITALVGLALFSAAILLQPARPHTTTDDKARELGALLVVKGGEYQPGNAASATVRLFIGTRNIWALDKLYQPLLVIPAAEMTSLGVDQNDGIWVVRVGWNEHAAEFCYHGVFAEHLAHLAESAIRGVTHSQLPALPRRRAASA
jgi:hypothetical protein